MVHIEIADNISAPIERVFDLARSIDLHVQTAFRTHETAIAGCTSGLIGPGETVTWRGKHFGLWFKHASKITVFERPTFFQDTMVEGAFKRYHHDHRFEMRGSSTVMTDVMEFEAPTFFGGIIESVFLRAHLARFLAERNGHIKRVAESNEWMRYLQPREGAM